MPEKKMSPATIAFAARLAVAVLSGLAALAEIKPVAVVGFGGFASFPTVFAGWLRRTPVYLHEQNTIMGLVNRVMTRFADKIFVSFEKTAGVPEGKAVFAGNPSRYEKLEKIDKKEARSRLGLDPERWTLFVFGGSQGAASINRSLYEFASANRDKADLQILHLTGRAKFDEAKKYYSEALAGSALRIDARDYLKEMELAYMAADLAFCRSGATTLTELASLGVPAILSPYPFATENHQEKNAKSFVDAGAAVMILDKELNGERIAAAIEELRGDPEKLRIMAERARNIYREGAAVRMAETLSAHLR